MNTATAIRNARLSLGYSQDELAQRLREHGHPSVAKRTVQRWEHPINATHPRRHFVLALAAILGISPEDLGPPVVQDSDGARHVRAWTSFSPPTEDSQVARESDGRLPGLWLSRYQYWSTGRQRPYISQYHVILVQNGTSVTVESLPYGVDPRLVLDLTVEGNVVTGTWDEYTDPHGHYLGERRWGALQFLMTPSHRYMFGKWVGWGSGNVVNSGPWDLTWLGADTSTEALAPYQRALPDEPVEWRTAP